MCCALSLADRGARVTLFERNAPGRGASWAAAGMLAPAFEAAGEPGVHPALFDLCLAGAEVWKSFSSRLTALTGRALDYGDAGALACAITQEQGERIMALASACEARGVPHICLEPEDARRREPSLSAELAGALELPTDQQIDNWGVVEALGAALADAEVRVLSGLSVTAIDGEPGNMHLDAAPDDVFDAVVWTVGESARLPAHYEGEITYLVPEGAIVPVKGQLFSLAPRKAGPRRVLRFGPGYVAPKASRIIVGSTSEWNVDDTHAELNVIEALRREAAQICPILAEGQITRIWAGVRPGTRDHGPILGASSIPGVYQATGHYRNGILLAPVTGELMAELVLEGRTGGFLEKFGMSRFDGAGENASSPSLASIR